MVRMRSHQFLQERFDLRGSNSNPSWRKNPTERFKSRTDKLMKTALGRIAIPPFPYVSSHHGAQALAAIGLFTPPPAKATSDDTALTLTDGSLRLSGRRAQDALTSTRKTRGARMAPAPSPADA
jgi:hypothetical protein